MSEKQEKRVINLLSLQEWQNNQTRKKDIGKISVDSQSTLQDFQEMLKKEAEKSWEKERLLLEKIGGSLYQFSNIDFESNVAQKEKGSWQSVFSYLKELSGGDDFEYWINILEIVSSQAFIKDLVNKSQKQIVKTISSENETNSTTPSLYVKKIRKFINPSGNIESYFNEEKKSLIFSPKEIIPKQMGQSDGVYELITDVVGWYESALKNALSEIQKLYESGEIIFENERGETWGEIEKKLLEGMKEKIRNIYTTVYQVMWRRAAIKAIPEVNGAETEILKFINNWIKKTKKEMKEVKSIEQITLTYNYQEQLASFEGREYTWILEISGGEVILSRYKKSEANATNKTGLDDFSKKEGKISNQTAKMFAEKLMDLMLSLITNYMGAAQSKKDQPNITNAVLRQKMTSLLEANFKDYQEKFIQKNPDGIDKEKNNVYQAYLRSSFGGVGKSNREALIQGTFGEILFSALLATKLDGFTKEEYEKAKATMGDKSGIIATYVNGQQLNDSEQQAHDDVVVIIDGKKIGIQVKQYNSKNIKTEGQSFYDDGKHNVFGDMAFSQKALGRYFTVKGENNEKNIKQIIEYLRLTLLTSDTFEDIDVTQVLYPHFLRFARIRDDLEDGLGETEDLTYNNFYVFNFALIPTSQILSQIIVNIDKDLKNNEKNAKGVFKIKPIQVEEGASNFNIMSNYDLKYSLEGKTKIAVGNLIFSGLNVKPSRWYNFKNEEVT